MTILDAKTEKQVLDTGKTALNLKVTPGNPAVPLGLILPIADLAPGSYTAHIDVFDSTVGEAMRRVAFTVEP